MKKTGIVTIHMINNYGALEQTYALNKYLCLNGIDAKTIDFRTYRVKESYQLFYPIHSAMDFVRNTQVLLYLNKLRKRNRRFHQFLKDNVPMTLKKQILTLIIIFVEVIRYGIHTVRIMMMRLFLDLQKAEANVFLMLQVWEQKISIRACGRNLQKNWESIKPYLCVKAVR